MEPTWAFEPRPGSHAVAGLPSTVAEAVACTSPGRRPEEYASRTEFVGFVVRPARRSTSSSGIRADRLALPDSVKVRAVGSVNWREMVVSGSSRGGYCEVRWRVITTVRRSAAEAVPRLVSIWVGICTTWCTCSPGISISEKPTADAEGGGAVSFVVPSMVTRSVWNVRAGNVRVCPAVTWEEAFSW